MWASSIGGIVTLILSLLTAPLTADAQPPGKIPRIGLLIPGSSSSFSSRIDACRQGLRDLGYVEGQHIALEYRYAENLDRIPDLAAELVRLPVALIMAWGATSALAAQHATTTIPREHAEAGSLLSYGASQAAMWRRAAAPPVRWCIPFA